MPSYRCRSCGEEVLGSPFRSTCPECGGQLQPAGRTRPS